MEFLLLICLRQPLDNQGKVNRRPHRQSVLGFVTRLTHFIRMIHQLVKRAI